MGLSSEKIIETFNQIANLRVGVVGDFAVDFYFQVNKDTQEFSVETKKEVFHANSPRSSLGGAGNVVQNLVVLGVKEVKVFGCVGNDIFGREMLHLFHQNQVNTAYLSTIEEGWDTCTYTKPFNNSAEENRLDFGTNNQISASVFDRIVDDIEQNLSTLDVLIINQQFPNPLLNQIRIQKLNQVLEKFPQLIVVADLRNFGNSIRNAILKVNTSELAKILAIEPFDEANFELCRNNALALHRKINCPILQTRGEYGILLATENEVMSIDGIKLSTKIDTVGAGDTVVAAFATAWGATSNLSVSLQIANLAAAITVQKINQTGTASLEEVLAIQFK